LDSRRSRVALIVVRLSRVRHRGSGEVVGDQLAVVPPASIAVET